MLAATTSHVLSPLAIPLITDRANVSSVSRRLETPSAPRSLISDSTMSALPRGVHALSLHATMKSKTSHALLKAVLRGLSISGPRRTLLAAHDADACGVARHPDRDRASLSLCIVPANDRSYDFHRRVAGAERVQDHSIPSE